MNKVVCRICNKNYHICNLQFWDCDDCLYEEKQESYKNISSRALISLFKDCKTIEELVALEEDIISHLNNFAKYRNF
jgi:hypothetical protein